MRGIPPPQPLPDPKVTEARATIARAVGSLRDEDALALADHLKRQDRDTLMAGVTSRPVECGEEVLVRHGEWFQAARECASLPG